LSELTFLQWKQLRHNEPTYVLLTRRSGHTATIVEEKVSSMFHDLLQSKVLNGSLLVLERNTFEKPVYNLLLTRRHFLCLTVVQVVLPIASEPCSWVDGNITIWRVLISLEWFSSRHHHLRWWRPPVTWPISRIHLQISPSKVILNFIFNHREED
jgi:hypothetical protein